MSADWEELAIEQVAGELRYNRDDLRAHVRSRSITFELPIAVVYERVKTLKLEAQLKSFSDILACGHRRRFESIIEGGHSPVCQMCAADRVEAELRDAEKTIEHLTVDREEAHKVNLELQGQLDHAQAVIATPEVYAGVVSEVAEKHWGELIKDLQRQLTIARRQADGQCDGCSEPLEDAFCNKCLAAARDRADKAEQRLAKLPGNWEEDTHLDRLEIWFPISAQMLEDQQKELAAARAGRLKLDGRVRELLRAAHNMRMASDYMEAVSEIDPERLTKADVELIMAMGKAEEALKG